MVWESHYWKSDLLKQGAVLRKRVSQKRWNDASLARCEQTIMIGFYSVRKLSESRKLTDRVIQKAFNIRCYPPTGELVTYWNCHKIERLYDLERPEVHPSTLVFLCNQIIHSYVFQLVFEDEVFSAIWVASDYQRSKFLVEVSVPTIIETFEMIGHDDIASIVSRFDPVKGDYSFNAS